MDFSNFPAKLNLAYCDYIADRIQKLVTLAKDEEVVQQWEGK